MIKIVKMLSEGEIIADITENQDTVTLKKPVRLIPVNEGLAMIPWLTLAKDQSSFTVSKQYVLCIYDPDDEITNGYNEKFGTGIVLPTVGKIIT